MVMKSLFCRRSPGADLIRVTIQEDDFQLDELYGELREQSAAAVGGIAIFVGLVRDRNAKAGTGDAVSTLTLEHYPGMTEKSIEGIVATAHDKWPLLDTIVVHRVGPLAPTDQIVVVLCASAHRDAAFAGAQYIMDYLKTDAVIWKKESTAAGDIWIEATSDDRDKVRDWQARREG